MYKHAILHILSLTISYLKESIYFAITASVTISNLYMQCLSQLDLSVLLVTDLIPVVQFH